MMPKSNHGKLTTLNEVESSNETGNEGRTRVDGLGIEPGFWLLCGGWPVAEGRRRREASYDGLAWGCGISMLESNQSRANNIR